MIWNDFKHLFKNMLQLKSMKYLYSLLYVILINLICLLYKNFNLNAIISTALILTLLTMAIKNLFASISIPINTKDKSKTTQYSNLYLYSLVQSYYPLLFTVISEATINSFIFSLTYFSIVLTYGKELVSYIQFFCIILLTNNFFYLASFNQSLRHFKLRISKISFIGQQIGFLKGIIPATSFILFASWFLRIEKAQHIIENHYLMFLTVLFVLMIYGSFSIYYNDILIDPSKSNYLKLRYNIPIFLLSFWLCDPLYQFQRKNYLIVFYVTTNDINSAKKLLDKKPSLINTLDEEGQHSLLSLAVRNNYGSMAKLLIEKGANINELDQNKWNYLHRSSLNCNLELAQFFIEKGIDKNAITPDKRNALFYATRNYCTQLIIYFNKIGMDKTLIDKEKNDYLNYSAKRNERFRRELPLLQSIGVIQ